MNSQKVYGPNSKASTKAAHDAEATLRLIASLLAPEGLEGRMIAGLHSAPRSGRVLSWPGSLAPTREWFRTAAAAAIAFAIVGGGWGVYSRVQPSSAKATMPRTGVGGGFSNAGAVRVPQTVPAPEAVHSAPAAVKPTPVKSDEAKPDDTVPVKKDHGKAATKSHQHQKAAGAKKASIQPPTPLAR